MSVTYPLPNATVLIIRSDRTYAVVTKTDENGKVTITVPPGTYDIYVIKNYFTIHHQVEIVDQNIVKTIKLEKLYTKEYINQYIAQLLGTVEGIYSTLQTIEENYPEIFKPWCIDALIREPEYLNQFSQTLFNISYDLLSALTIRCFAPQEQKIEFTPTFRDRDVVSQSISFSVSITEQS